MFPSTQFLSDAASRPLVTLLDSGDVMELTDAVLKASRDAMRLRPGASVMDVGPEVGLDHRALRALLDDPSRIVAADGRAASSGDSPGGAVDRFLRQWNGTLPFGDDFVSAVRLIEAFSGRLVRPQHLAEFARVLAPAGRLVSIEPDWGTFRFHGPDFYGLTEAVARTVTETIALRSWRFRTREFGRGLSDEMLRAVGLRPLWTAAYERRLDGLATVERLVGVTELVDELVDRNFLKPTAARSFGERLSVADETPGLSVTVDLRIFVLTKD